MKERLGQFSKVIVAIERTRVASKHETAIHTTRLADEDWMVVSHHRATNLVQRHED